MKRNKLIQQIKTTDPTATELAIGSCRHIIQIPKPIPRLTQGSLQVLRLVRSRDPYRRLDGTPLVKKERQKVLRRLERAGLVHFTRQQFWRITTLGIETLLRYPIRYNRTERRA
jgi:hypothetical protein